MKQRLRIIADMVTEGNTIADIGTDHGFLPIELVRSGKSPGAIAMDIVEGPIKRAAEHIAQAGLNDKIECRLSDGFDGLEYNEADTAVIAGMGGDLIASIIASKPGVTRELVLSPHTHWEAVRRALRESGYSIADERMLKDDNKFYVFIRAEREKNVSEVTEEMYDHFGRLLIERRDPILKEFLNKEFDKYKDISQKKEYTELVKSTLDIMR